MYTLIFKESRNNIQLIFQNNKQVHNRAITQIISKIEKSTQHFSE